MILETAVLHVKKDQQESVERDFQTAGQYISSIKRVHYFTKRLQVNYFGKGRREDFLPKHCVIR